MVRFSPPPEMRGYASAGASIAVAERPSRAAVRALRNIGLVFSPVSGAPRRLAAAYPHVTWRLTDVHASGSTTIGSGGDGQGRAAAARGRAQPRRGQGKPRQPLADPL